MGAVWGEGEDPTHCLSGPHTILVKADFDKINVTFTMPYWAERTEDDASY